MPTIAEKLAAYAIFNKALREQRLLRQPCEVCGMANANGHHDDYSKPLDVKWLCTTHHGQLHARTRAPRVKHPTPTDNLNTIWIPEREMRKRFRQRVQRLGGCVAAARAWNISPCTISDILNGRREPGPTLLHALGWAKDIRYKVVNRR